MHIRVKIGRSPAPNNNGRVDAQEYPRSQRCTTPPTVPHAAAAIAPPETTQTRAREIPCNRSHPPHPHGRQQCGCLRRRRGLRAADQRGVCRPPSGVRGAVLGYQDEPCVHRFQAVLVGAVGQDQGEDGGSAVRSGRARGGAGPPGGPGGQCRLRLRPRQDPRNRHQDLQVLRHVV